MFENNMTDQFSFCSLNWGNGRRDKFPFYEECDDGNNLSYDGWSLNWEIEENYVCNQNETGTDIWTSVFDNPKILSLSFDDSKLEIVIEFDQTMKSQKNYIFWYDIRYFRTNFSLFINMDNKFWY